MAKPIRVKFDHSHSGAMRRSRRVSLRSSKMRIEDKVGQLTEVDIASITPKNLETYKRWAPSLMVAIPHRTTTRSHRHWSGSSCSTPSTMRRLSGRMVGR